MALTTIPFAGDSLGLIVRGKRSPSDHPANMEQHADCVLADGSPVGYFGGPRAGSGGSANRIGLGMNGYVSDYTLMTRERPFYVDAGIAMRYGVVSTLLVARATPAQASAFSAYWASLRSTPGTFNIIGNNCSTHASDAFIAAGLVTGGIPGLDTPDHLYDQLVAALPGRATSYSGYVGFARKVGGTGFDVLVDTL
jgi:hypothetical protein